MERILVLASDLVLRATKAVVNDAFPEKMKIEKMPRYLQHLIDDVKSAHEMNIETICSNSVEDAPAPVPITMRPPRMSHGDPTH